MDLTGISPMMKNYLETREQYPDCILFYRLGDFYEMFFDDAITVSKELELTLTGKSCGLEERAPMCGVPFHSASTYINRLVSRGYKVAVCEQMEDPKQARGLVKREVIRVITPGTNLEGDAENSGRHNYIMSIFSDKTAFGLSLADVSTGDFILTEKADVQGVMDEIAKYSPSEIVSNQASLQTQINVYELKDRMGITLSPLGDSYFSHSNAVSVILTHFHISSLEALGISDYKYGVQAAGALLAYLLETQKNKLSHITNLAVMKSEGFMILDASTRRNLELTETLREKKKTGSLLGVLDRTRTAMGARELRSYLERPLSDASEILRRLDALEELSGRAADRDEMREYLDYVYDLEHLMGRISYGSANGKDMVALRNSLGQIPHIIKTLEGCRSGLLSELSAMLDPLEDLCELLTASIQDEPPLTLTEGGIIKDGYNETVDSYRTAKTQGREWLAELENRERESTGIKNLKIKYNSVFGYFLEVTNSFKNLVPSHYIRRQTLTGSERYTTEELKDLENRILGAQDKLYSLEYELFCDIRKKAGDQVLRIQKTARALAALDAMCSLSLVSERNSYVRPDIGTDGIIDIREGRHPVVEQNVSNDQFISNNTYLDNGEHLISIITGPNMAGKSTYMRQVALIVLMAQIGCFVPAESASIGIVDRIFTRVGASDDLASGQSTFMVEMNEVANILRNANGDSLLILDEIGRGTSTFDGLSIAWSVIEHISDVRKMGAKTLFATHYHELTELEGLLPNVDNYRIMVKEQSNGDIIFLRKIVRGGADKSYGIQVARLAGIPDSVIDRSLEILADLLSSDINNKKGSKHRKTKIVSAGDTVPVSDKDSSQNFIQMSLFDRSFSPAEQKVLDDIRSADISGLRPIDALNLLDELKKRLEN